MEIPCQKEIVDFSEKKKEKPCAEDDVWNYFIFETDNLYRLNFTALTKAF